MPPARTTLRALRHDDRQVRAHLLDVAKRVQELAAELDRLVACRCAGRTTCASPSSWTSLPSPLASARRAVASGDAAVAADRADARVVDLERVVVGIVAQPVALDLRAQRAVGAEALDHEARSSRSRARGAAARRRVGASTDGALRTSHQVAEAEQRHQQQRQVGRDEVEQAQRPGRARRPAAARRS